MNIADLLGNVKPTHENTIASKIAVKSEMKKIEREADEIVEQIINFFARESEFINKGLTYGCDPKNISEEDKNALLKKLEEATKQIPSKVKESIDDIFTSSENKEDSSKEEAPEENKEQSSTDEIKVAIAPTQLSSLFGY